MEDLGFRSHLSHQTLVTEVRSGTFTPRKRTFDPHKLNCGTTTTFLPLQFSPPVEPRSPLRQTEPTADSITHSTGTNGVGLEEVQAEASKRIFTSAERLGRKAEIITPFCSVCYLFISFWKSNRSLTGKRGHWGGMKRVELQKKVRKVRKNWRQWRNRNDIIEMKDEPSKPEEERNHLIPLTNSVAIRYFISFKWVFCVKNNQSWNIQVLTGSDFCTGQLFVFTWWLQCGGIASVVSAFPSLLKREDRSVLDDHPCSWK